MSEAPSLGSAGSAYFRSFLDSNKEHGGTFAQKKQVSPRASKLETHVKIAEARFNFDKRKTLFRPKYMVVAELYQDGFVEVYRATENGRTSEQVIEKVSLLLTDVKDAKATKFKHASFLFELPGGKTYTFSYDKQDVAALEFLRVTKKLAHSLKIDYQNTLLSVQDRRGRGGGGGGGAGGRSASSSGPADAGLSTDSEGEEGGNVVKEGGGAVARIRSESTMRATGDTNRQGGGSSKTTTSEDDGPLSQLRLLLHHEKVTYERRRISKSGDYSRFGWRGVDAEEFLKLEMSPVKVLRSRVNLKRNFNERTSIPEVMLKSIMGAIQRLVPQVDEFMEKAVYTAKHKFQIDPKQFPVRLALVVDTPTQDVLFEHTSADSLLRTIPELDLVVPLADLASRNGTLDETIGSPRDDGDGAATHATTLDAGICVIDPRHLNNDGSTSFQRLKDLFVRDRPMFEVAALVFLTQPAPSVLRQLSECDELRARLFGTTEYVEAGETKAKNDPHVLILDQHCVQMSESVFALNNSVSLRRLFDFTEEIEADPAKVKIPQLDRFAERVVDALMSVHEFPYVRFNVNDALAEYVAKRTNELFVNRVRDNQDFWFHGMQKATSRGEMVVFGRFQDLLSPLIGNSTTGFLMYQHHFDFEHATKSSDGVVHSASFMHHDFNFSTMPREIDQTENRLTPLSPQVARLWALCRDLPFLKVKNLVQGYAFAGDEILRRELESCRPSSRVRLEQVLRACEKAAGMDIETTYHELLALMNEIVTGYGIVGRSLQKLPLSTIVDKMCLELPFIESSDGICALMKSAVITLFLMRNDSMTHNEKGELFEMANVSGSDVFLPQNMPKYILDMNHESPALNLSPEKLLNSRGEFVPFFVSCAQNALNGMLPQELYPYVNPPPPGFEPFNAESLDDMIPQDLLRAHVEPMLIIVVVGGLSFNELQEIDKLVRRTKRTVLCITMNVVTGSMYMVDMFTN